MTEALVRGNAAGRLGELEQISCCWGHASVQTTDEIPGHKAGSGARAERPDQAPSRRLGCQCVTASHASTNPNRSSTQIAGITRIADGSQRIHGSIAEFRDCRHFS